MSDDATQYMMDLFNDVITSIDKYSNSLLSLSSSSNLYKGKGKLKHLPASYRRFSMGLCFRRLVDDYIDYLSVHTQAKSKASCQFGFSAGINFLLATVAKESMQK